MLEEVPRLGDDAEELSIRIMSTFEVKHRGTDIVLRDWMTEITSGTPLSPTLSKRS